MVPRLGVLLLLLLLIPATSASAAVPRSAAAVKLAGCDTDAASATFESVMRTVPQGTGLDVRFVLEVRTPGTRWGRVTAPGFGRWLTAKAGKTRFVYDKTITGLAAPGDYRVLVAFRWRDAGGAVVARAKRRSPACRQPDPRPDLRPVALERSPAGWVLTVVNAGGEATPEIPAALTVGGRELRGRVAALEPADDTGVYFDGVTCAPGETLTATVDPDDDLDEADESGNAISVTCPGS